MPHVELEPARLFTETRQRRPQAPGIVAPGFKAQRLLRIGRQPGLYFGTTARFEPVIDIGMQLVLAGYQMGHLSLRKAGGCGLSSVSSRKAARARERRDMTVPMGIPMA